MKMFIKGITVAILLAGFMGFAAQATVINAPITADTELRGWVPKTNSNWNYRSDMGVGIWGSGSQGPKKILVAADLPTLPTGEVLVSAVLKLYPTTSWGDGTYVVPVSAYRMLESWNAGEVTWDYRVKSTSTDNWLGVDNAQGDGNHHAAVASALTILPSAFPDPADWQTWDLTADVADMYANGGNYGWLLASDVTTGNTRAGNTRGSFVTSEGTANTPYLEITTAPIPEPGSLFLLGTGLLSLVSFVRRKRS